MSQIAELIKKLNSEDEKTRAFAAEDIAYDGMVEGIGHLVARMQVEPSHFVREVIANSLKNMRHHELVDKVIPWLRSDDAFMRNAAIAILSAQGELAVPSIKDLLHDPDKDLRKFALDILFQMREVYVDDLIVEALNDPELNIVITAVEYLGQLESLAYAPVINRVFASSDNLLLRCTCLETLAIIGDDDSAALLTKMYSSFESVNPIEQYSLLKFLARKGSLADLSFIVSLIKNKGLVMVKEIINAVEGILSRQDMELLPDELLSTLVGFIESDINDINKYELLILMSKFRNPGIFSILTGFLNPAHGLVCLGAVEGLEMFGEPLALPYLIKLKNQVKEDDLWEAIDKALQQLDG